MYIRVVATAGAVIAALLVAACSEPTAQPAPDTPIATPIATPTLTPEESAVTALSGLLSRLQIPPDDAHAEAAEALVAIWMREAVLVEQIAQRPWLADGVSEDEAAALASLSGLAALDLALAQSVVELPWLADNVSIFERWTVHSLHGLSVQSIDLATDLLRRPWMADEVSEDDIAFAQEAIGLPWFAYAGSSEVSNSLLILHWMHKRYPVFAASVMALPWLADGISGTEYHSLIELRQIADQDIELAGSLVDSPVAGGRHIRN